MQRDTRSFYARYRSTDDGYLLGAVKQGQSSRYQSHAEACLRLQTVIDVHDPGRVAGEVLESKLPPEIFTHCGRHPTTYGAKCPGCGKVLTKKDARKTQPIGGV